MLISLITDNSDRYSCSQKIWLQRDPPVFEAGISSRYRPKVDRNMVKISGNECSWQGGKCTPLEGNAYQSTPCVLCILHMTNQFFNVKLDKVEHYYIA